MLSLKKWYFILLFPCFLWLSCSGGSQVLPASSDTATLTLHNIYLVAQPNKGRVRVEDSMTLGAAARQAGAIDLQFSADATLGSVKIDGVVIEGLVLQTLGGKTHLNVPISKRAHQLQISLTFRQPYEDESLAGVYLREDLILLSGEDGWYPAVIEGENNFRFTIEAPRGWHVAGPGILTHRETKGDFQVQTYEADQHLPWLDLAIGPFHLQTQIQEGQKTTPRLYQLAERARLGETWLIAAQRQLSHLEHHLNDFPSQYLTLLELPDGIDFSLSGGLVLNSQRFEDSSPDETLGRYLLENAFESLSVKTDEGDWRPAAITYLMSLAPIGQTLAPAPSEHREKWLRDWRFIEGPGHDRPLAEAQELGPETIGRGAMFLHQLNLWVGDDAFYGALSRLSRQSAEGAGGWGALEREMSREAEQDLFFLFDPWLNRLGAPQLSLLKVEEVGLALAEDQAPIPALKITVGRDGFIAPLKIPITVEMSRGTIQRTITLDGPSATTFIPLQPIGKNELKYLREPLGSDKLPTYKRRLSKTVQNTQMGGSAFNRSLGRPISVRIDPNFDALRELWPAELLPRISDILKDPEVPILLGQTPSLQKESRILAEYLNRQVILQDALSQHSAIVLGRWSDVYSSRLEMEGLRLPLPRDLIIEDGVVWQGLTPYNTDRVVGLFAVPTPWDPTQTALVVLTPGASFLRKSLESMNALGQAGFILLADTGPLAKGRYKAGPNPLYYQFPVPESESEDEW